MDKATVFLAGGSYGRDDREYERLASVLVLLLVLRAVASH